MPVELADISGNPYVGVFCKLAGEVLLAPHEVSDAFVAMADRALGVRTVRTMLGGTNLHGSLLAINRNGIMAPYFFDREEIDRAMRQDDDAGDINVYLSDDPHTAWGNNLLMGDDVAIANPDLSPGTLGKVSEIFDVEAVPMTLAGVKTVGSVAVLNSKGVLVHPKTTPSELDVLKDLFGRDVAISTVNFGSPYLGSSIIANDRGAIIGSRSSGVEINRIENTLDLIGR